MKDDEFLRATLPAMDLVYNLARRVAPTSEDARDLVQDTYLAALRAWRNLRRPRKVEPWLATICLNLARSGYRRRARRPREVVWEAAMAIPDEQDVEGEALERLSQQAVHRAMWALNENQRIALALVDLCGFSTWEAARIAKVPRGTILSRLHRGRRALALLLRDEVEERET